MIVENGVLLEVTNEDIIDGKFEFPDGVTHIGDRAFDNCKSLARIEIPEGVTSIGNGAFSGCISLTTIEIPNSVTSIGNSAFSVSYTHLTLPTKRT